VEDVFVTMVYQVLMCRRDIALSKYYMKNNTLYDKGFNLIELLIVLAIIGVLASFLLTNFIGAKARARDAQRKSDLRQIQSALELYRTDQGSYPKDVDMPACGGSLTFTDPVTLSITTYIQKMPCDPLSATSYSYIRRGGGSTYALTACLENLNDSQKDSPNLNPQCNGTTSVSYTLNNP